MEDIREFFGENIAGLDKDFLNNHESLYLGRIPNKIEIFQKASGLEFDDAYAKRVATSIHGLPVNIIALEGMKVNKQASGPYKDLADWENL